MTAHGIHADERVGNEKIGREPELEGLAMEGPSRTESPKLGTGLESKREGMEVEGQVKATHFDEQEEGGDRGSEEGVGSDDGVVAER